MNAIFTRLPVIRSAFIAAHISTEANKIKLKTLFQFIDHQTYVGPGLEASHQHMACQYITVKLDLHT